MSLLTISKKFPKTHKFHFLALANTFPDRTGLPDMKMRNWPTFKK